jgi:DNA polymerase
LSRVPAGKDATQTVFGEGAEGAEVMLVGEQPGDREDREGHPFVGPAGRILDEAVADAGLDPDLLYVTNAVKHFKWKAAERGKRRIHQKPRAKEVAACGPWLEAELEVVSPRALVCLGATAAKTLLGPEVTRGQSRAQGGARCPRLGPARRRERFVLTMSHLQVSLVAREFDRAATAGSRDPGR